MSKHGVILQYYFELIRTRHIVQPVVVATVDVVFFFLLRNWPVKHLPDQNLAVAIAILAYIPVQIILQLENNSGAQPCINKCRHFFNRKSFLWHISSRFSGRLGGGPRCHALCFPYVCVISPTHTWEVRVLDPAVLAFLFFFLIFGKKPLELLHQNPYFPCVYFNCNRVEFRVIFEAFSYILLNGLKRNAIIVTYVNYKKSLGRMMTDKILVRDNRLVVISNSNCVAMTSFILK